MRQGQQKNRMRGRNRKGPNPLTRSFESNGGDVKLRGTALHIAEKYVQLARDSQTSGDRVAAENYFQHAEHYYRIVAAAQAQMPQPQQIIRNDEGDFDDETGEFRNNGGYPGERQQGVPQQGNGQPIYNGEQPQPYLNGTSEGGDDDGGERDGYSREEQNPSFRQGLDATLSRSAGQGYAPQGGGNYRQNDQGSGGYGRQNNEGRQTNNGRQNNDGRQNNEGRPNHDQGGQGGGGQQNPQGAEGGAGGQGQGERPFRGRRRFRDRYNNNDRGDRNANGNAEGGQRTERADNTGAPLEAPESSED